MRRPVSSRATRDGAVIYINATLASWLDYDLAQFGSGGAACSPTSCAGDGAALLAAVAGARQRSAHRDSSTSISSAATARACRCACFHRVAFAQDGTPGASRTLVLNRAPGEEPSEDLRAAEVRFARFFNKTPMAIAAVDRERRIVRTNAAFARLLPEALTRDRTARARSSPASPSAITRR